MKKSTIILLAVIGGLVLLGLLLVGWYVGTYNSIVGLEESVNAAEADVDSTYQRRLDLIPNLVSTVQGAADFEQETQTQIANLRSEAVSAQQNFAQADDLAAQQAAAQQGESVLTRFFAIVENYPQLTATANFRDLQVQLEGTENRINVARDRYNDAVRAYNTRINRIPANIVAGMSGFEEAEFFEAAAGAEEAPVVEFN